MIGSGIFIAPSIMAGLIATPGIYLGLWLVGGALTLLGALAYGELCAMMPKAGGQYVFLREAFGPLVGFLYGWTVFLVIQSGFNAAVAIAFSKFLGGVGLHLGENDIVSKLGVLHAVARADRRGRHHRRPDVGQLPRRRSGRVRAEPLHGAQGRRHRAARAHRLLQRARARSRNFSPARRRRARRRARDGHDLARRRRRRHVEGALRLRRVEHGHLRRRGDPRAAAQPAARARRSAAW